MHTVSFTNSGKIYTNSSNGVRVVEDLNGSYFRRHDSSISGRRGCLDRDGNIPNNKTLENGRQVGRNQSEYNAVTHFKIEK